jgi:hypothetical protein
LLLISKRSDKIEETTPPKKSAKRKQSLYFPEGMLRRSRTRRRVSATP